MILQAQRPLLAGLGFLLCLTSTVSSQEMTETEALQRFERENSSLKVFSAQIKEVQADVRLWSRLSNPSITFTQEDAAATRDEFFLIQQSLPINGRLGLLRKAGRATVGSVEAEAAYRRIQLRSDFRAAFFELLAEQERVSLLENGVLPLREIVRVLREREKEREGSAFDRLRAERELAEVGATLEMARILLVEAQSRLGSFLASGSDPSSLKAKGDFFNATPLPPLEDLTARALIVRGDYLAQQRRVERFGYERQAAKRLIIPEPVISAGFKRTTIPGFDDRGYAASVTIPLPLFDTGRTRQALATAAIEQSEAAAAVLRRAAETEVRSAYEALKLYRRIAQDYPRDLGDRGEQLSQISRLSYVEGEQGILELLDSHRVALNSRLQALELALSAKLAEIELNRAAGEEIL
jgi:cobalt-zinc-cadmium efflux system outer membrane protein